MEQTQRASSFGDKRKKCRGLSPCRGPRSVGLLHVITTHRNRKFKNVSTNKTPHRKRFSSQCRRVGHDFRGQVRDQNNTTQPANKILLIHASIFGKIEFSRVYDSPKDASLSCRLLKNETCLNTRPAGHNHCPNGGAATQTKISSRKYEPNTCNLVTLVWFGLVWFG